MDNFIRELYYGNISPSAKQFDRHSPYGKALQRAAENEDKLTERLTGEEQAIFAEYVRACGEVLGESAAETFVDGFRVGAHFVMDTFVSKDSAFKPITG